jgi:hypothetical protein
MPWPDSYKVRTSLERAGKELEVILQVGKGALKEASNVEDIIKKLRPYTDFIHYVLLDKSMGTGEGMDAHGFIPVARAIKDAFPELGIVAAGGLGPKTMELIVPLLEVFPDISWDAQGQLRSSGNALDPIGWDRAKMYLVESLNLLQ